MKQCSVCHRCLEDATAFCPEDGAPLGDVFPGPAILDGKYRLLRGLGRGGMGRVLKARHLVLKRLVALKLLDPDRAADPGFVSGFEREAEILGQLQHPSIVSVSDFGIESERELPYLVMEYLEGETLGDRLRREGSLPPATALPLLSAIADALDYAHASGVLHRDLKPANVFLVEKRSQAPAVRVLDFGLSRFFTDREATTLLGEGPADEVEAGSERSEPSAVLGTRGYAAPELLRAERATPAADIFSFGALVHEVLTGDLPSGGVAHGELDPELRRPLSAALHPDPSRRPASARQMVAELRQASLRLQRRRQKPRRLTATALLGLLAGNLALVLERPLAGVEQRWRDVCFARAPPRVPRHPLLVVLIDDESLAADPTPLSDPGQADRMGELLSRVLDSGAAGVGIDLLLPESWSRSDAFSDFVVRHADAVVLGAFSPPEGPVIGPAAVSGLTAAALGPARATELFGYVNLDVDADGVARRARARYPDVAGRAQPAFAARLAEKLDPELLPHGGFFPIDATLDWRRFDRISWRHLGAALDREPDRFRGRLVLVGTNYVGGEAPYRMPHPRALPAEVPGPMLQAVIVHTLLDGLPFTRASRAATFALAVSVAALAAAGVFFARRPGGALLTVLAVTVGWTAGAYGAFLRYYLLPAIPVVAALVSAAAAAAVVRRFGLTSRPVATERPRARQLPRSSTPW